jgi:L-2-hydroxyglutarate oxidase
MALRKRLPRYSLAVIDKEPEVAFHQIGHNSGVIHAGIYYKPGSQKARLCIEGARMMMEFCSENGVPYERCGKLIVATTDKELPRLHTLYERGRAKGSPRIRLGCLRGRANTRFASTDDRHRRVEGLSYDDSCYSTNQYCPV